MSDPVAITDRSTTAFDHQGGSIDDGGSPPSASSARRKPAPIDDFLKAIEPFFQDGSIVYVDVGAHRGAVLQAIVEKGPRLRRALLVEPNPASFAALEERIGALGLGERARCFNMALAGAPGRLRLVDADDMSRVLDRDVDAGPCGRTFEIEASTLDALLSEFPKPHVNLLKIDVEGFELSVLDGAAGLLAAQAIDMIYVEAGLDPETTQQTYYRRVEDALAAHGYRLFRIFEQVHEWREDSPFLRRVNLAFMSQRFASAHPYRLCAALLEKRRANEALKRDLEAETAAGKLARKELERLRAVEMARTADLLALGALRAEHETLKRDLEAETAEAARLRAEIEETRAARAEALLAGAQLAGEQQRLAQELSRQEALAVEADARLAKERSAAASSRTEGAELRQYVVSLEKRYAQVLGSSSWRITGPLRRALRYIKGGKPPVEFVPRLWTAKGTGRDKRGGTGWRGASPGSAKQGKERAGTGDTVASAEVKRYAYYLWAGHSRASVRELERVMGDPAYLPDQKYEAAQRLATWYAFDDDLDAALRSIRAIDRVAPRRSGGRERLIKEGFIQLQRGDRPAAKVAFERLLNERSGLRFADATLALANCLDGDEPRLAQFNKVFARAGYAGITRIDPTRPLALDNIRGIPATCAIPQTQKVSVIMPAYAAASTIRTAIRSLQEQTYRNLEIIVVDDCSPDGTFEVAAEMAKADDRIVAIRQEQNSGAYPARNLGLARATGAFITTHDADDWSHPQKIERQMAFMAGESDVMGVCTFWIRTLPDLQVTSNWRIGDRVIHWSHSSFLFRREVVERLGSWDPVRVGADTEFIWRVEAAYGKDAVRTIDKSVPLAFALDDDGSLTRTKQTHVRTIHFGVRQIYRAVAQHSHLRRGGLARDFAARRLAALPAVLLNSATGPVALDHLMMGDCRNPAIIAQMMALVGDPRMEGKRIGVFHWPDFAAPEGAICAAYADLLLDHGVIAVPPQTEVSLASRFAILFGDCTLEPDFMPVLVAPPEPSAA